MVLPLGKTPQNKLNNLSTAILSLRRHETCNNYRFAALLSSFLEYRLAEGRPELESVQLPLIFVISQCPKPETETP